MKNDFNPADPDGTKKEPPIELYPPLGISGGRSLTKKGGDEVSAEKDGKLGMANLSITKGVKDLMSKQNSVNPQFGASGTGKSDRPDTLDVFGAEKYL